MSHFRLPFLCLWLMASPFSLAEIYKWIDAQGKVQFSETAPENTPAEKLDGKLQETGNFLDYADLGEAPEITSGDKEKTETAVTAEPLEIQIELIEYELSAATLDTIHATINDMYYAYRLWFDWPAQPQYPITIKLFGNIKTFEDYQQQNNYAVRSNSFYSRSPNREIIMKGAIESAALNTLYHEVSHAILHMQQPYSSKWLNEGLSEVFSNNNGSEDNLPVLATDKKWVSILKQMLEDDSLRNISDYLSIPDQQWKDVSSREKDDLYMVAWSILYFMVHDAEGRDTLKAIFAINQKQPLYTANLVSNLDRLYPGGISKLDENWRQWLSDIE